MVTGAHLSETFGRTVEEIEKDGFQIAERVESLLGSDTPRGRAKSIGVQITGLVQAFSRLEPDLLLAPCDREEAISTALAGTYLNLPVAHLYGGDKTESGIVDDQVRHAVTKLAHVHLVMTQEHAERVLRLGEELWRVHVVGHGGLDRLPREPELDRRQLSERLGIDLSEGPIGIVIQHAMSNDIERAAEHMQTTLDAVADSDLRGVIIYPNSDAGGQASIRAILQFTEGQDDWRAFPNLPRREFVNLLLHADVLVGNSTCGIQEAPSLGLPVVNVGPRQIGRLHGDNVLFVSHKRRKIVDAIHRALTDAEFLRLVVEKRNPFGDGRTGGRVAGILASLELGPRLLHKDITF